MGEGGGGVKKVRRVLYRSLVARTNPAFIHSSEDAVLRHDYNYSIRLRRTFIVKETFECHKRKKKEKNFR